jgi:hypothetical protein
VALQVFVTGAINHTHSAFANLFDETAVTKRLANQRIMAQALLRHRIRLIPLTL